MIFKYYLEIKNRFILLLITWVSTIFSAYIYKNCLFFLFIKPNINILSKVFLYFIYTNITEIFSTYLELIFFLSNQIFLIYFFYHFLVFLSPGFYDFEYKYLKLIFVLVIIFWCFSILILNNFLLPITWYFFINFQESLNNQTIKLYFEAKINEYLKFYIILYYICNLNCQIFTLLIVFLNYINANLNFLKQIRKFFYFLFVLLATLITPPDVISQIILSLSIIIIYEFIILSILFKISVKNLKFN